MGVWVEYLRICVRTWIRVAHAKTHGKKKTLKHSNDYLLRSLLVAPSLLAQSNSFEEAMDWIHIVFFIDGQSILVCNH